MPVAVFGLDRKGWQGCTLKGLPRRAGPETEEQDFIFSFAILKLCVKSIMKTRAFYDVTIHLLSNNSFSHPASV
jgi:hypothetical protein